MVETKHNLTTDSIEIKKESTVKVTDFPSHANQFWKKFAQLFLQEKFEEARETAQSFLDNYYYDSVCLSKLKSAFELLGDKDSLLYVIELMLEIDPKDHVLIKEREELLYIEKEPELLEVPQETITNEAVFVPSDLDIADFLNLFQGRENSYARQWKNSSGNSGYTPVTEPLSFKVVRNHLLGNYTVGQYQLDLDNRVKWLVIDIDVTKPNIDRLSSPAFRKEIRDSIHHYYLELKSHLTRYDIHLYAEDSGHKGFHFWIFLAEKMAASTARQFLIYLTSQLKLEDDRVHVELFPKQSKANQLGNLVKLPLGVHQMSGKRSLFLDDDFRPIGSLSILKDIKLTSLSSILLSFQEWKKNEEIEPVRKKEIEIEKEELALIPPMPAAYSFDLEEHEEYLWLMEKCSTLSLLVNKIKKTGSITNDERIVLTYTFGHLSKGNFVVNELLNLCEEMSPEYLLKSPLKGNVISCQKIRRLLDKYLGLEGCKCNFKCPLNSYLHPLLHLKELTNAENIHEIRLKVLIDEYINCNKEMKELTRKMEHNHALLQDYFEKSGVTEIETSYGILRKNEETGQFILNL